jgi:hypothetical protein
MGWLMRHVASTSLLSKRYDVPLLTTITLTAGATVPYTCELGLQTFRFKSV